MKVTDYIISFFANKGIYEFFGYPGGVICHLIDSASKYPNVHLHINYNEQGLLSLTSKCSELAVLILRNNQINNLSCLY